MASEVFDVCVVGGGIVGLCVARQLLLEGLSVVLFERSSGVLCAASGRNSSILHCGFDARSECPLEQRLVQEGSALWRELIRKTPGMFAARQQGQYGGGLVVAWTEEEEKVLPTLLQKARANKCPEVQLLSKEQLQRFGVLHESARAGLWVPNEIVADSWIAGMFVFHQALEMGLKLRLNCAVWSVRQREEDKLLIINDSAVVARRLVNAAGTEADRVEAMRPGGPLCQFESRPRLGEFVVFECKDKPVDALPIIYPVPTERTKGVLIWQNLAGYLVVGPTARDVDSREVALDAVDERSCKDLENFARKKLNVVGKRVLAYCGLRPATEHADYIVKAKDFWVTVAGIRSTGFTSSLALGRYVASLMFGERAREPIGQDDPRWSVVPSGFDAAILVKEHPSPHPQTALRFKSKL